MPLILESVLSLTFYISFITHWSCRFCYTSIYLQFHCLRVCLILLFELNLEYRTFTKVIHRVSHTLHPVIPYVNILQNHRVIIKTKKNWLWYNLILHRAYSDFTNFPMNVTFSFQDPMFQLAVMSFLVSSNLWQFLSLLLFL